MQLKELGLGWLVGWLLVVCLGFFTNLTNILLTCLFREETVVFSLVLPLKVACSSLFSCLYFSIKHTGVVVKNIKTRVVSFKALSVALIDLGKKKML